MVVSITMDTEYYPESNKRWLVAEDYDFGPVTGNIVSSFTTRKFENPIEFYKGTQHFPILCPIVHAKLFSEFGVPAVTEMVAIAVDPDSMWYLIPIPDDI